MLKRIFRSIAILALVAGLAAPIPVLADEETIVSIKNNPEVTAGDNLVVTVEINQVADLTLYQFDITFNPQLLSLESITNGRIGGLPVQVGHYEKDDGLYHIRAEIDEGISGSGSLATIIFSAISGGNASIALRDGKLNDSQLQAVWLGSSITVLPNGEQQTAEVTPADSKNEANIVIRQPVESQTIVIGAEDGSASEVTSGSVSDGDIKWPIIGGILGGALIMVILALLPKSGKEKGYLD